MNRVKVLLVFSASLVVLFSTCSQAQSFGPNDFYFTSFICSPTNCDDWGPMATQGAAVVMLDATCSKPGGEVAHISGQSSVIVGTTDQCHAPFQPHALIERHTPPAVMDDCNVPRVVEFMRGIGEIYDSSFEPVYVRFKDVQCDGIEADYTVHGAIPC